MDQYQFPGEHGMDVSQAVYQAIASVVYNPRYANYEFSRHEPLEALAFLNGIDQRHGLNLKQEALFNSWFDSGTALGQISKMAAMLSIYFPDLQMSIAEIQKNAFVPYFLERYSETGDEQYLDDVLFAESNRYVLLFSDRIIDPLAEFTEVKEVLPDNFSHSLSRPAALWETIAAAKMANQMLVVDDFSESQLFYGKAEAIHKGLLITKRFWALCLMSEGMISESLRLAKSAHAISPTAASFYLLYYLTEDKYFLDELKRRYPEAIIPKIKARLTGLL